jgi:hypothetical protein
MQYCHQPPGSERYAGQYQELEEHNARLEVTCVDAVRAVSAGRFRARWKTTRGPLSSGPLECFRPDLRRGGA